MDCTTDTKGPENRSPWIVRASLDSSQRHVTRVSLQVHVGPVRSDSVGTVRLRSADPAAPPRIQPRYLSTQSDVDAFRLCIQHSREIFQQKVSEQGSSAMFPQGPPGPQEV